MSNPHSSLQRVEAEARFDQLQVTAYDVRLDLAADDATFRSVTTIRFESSGGDTFVDLKPVRLTEARLDGRPLDVASLDRGRLPISVAPGEHELVVDAVMRFRHDGEGLHRSIDPADGLAYVYGMSFMDAAPSIFACFDQPDLKAPYTLHVTAPVRWTVVGNAPGKEVEPGKWEFEQTPPLSTYFVTLVAGPWHVVSDKHDGIPLGLSARRSLAAQLDDQAGELLTVTRQCFDEFHRLFGIRYPFGNYHQAFVPEFNAGAMENPGCVTFRDPLIFTSRVPRGAHIYRAVVVAHEMAHQWFGNITTPKWWDDLWLNESFAEYMGFRVTADVTEFSEAWTHQAFVRRQWGLIADQRPTTHPIAGNGALDASAALQDFDGISYAKGSSVLKQLNATIGDDVFMAGVVDHLTRHRFGNATMHDLLASWEQAGAGDLGGFTDSWLRTAGVDAISWDRDAGVLRRTQPDGAAANRTHTVRVASAPRGAASWTVEAVTLDGEATPWRPQGDAAVVLDPYEDSWALTGPDQPTLDALVDLLPETNDSRLRAGIWNGVRTAFHNAAADPDDVIRLIEAGIPHETDDDGIETVLAWALNDVLAVVDDHDHARARMHEACRRRTDTAAAGSTVQLAAFQGLVASASDPTLLGAWRDGREMPDGLDLDEDLSWRIFGRLAALGEIDRAGLDAALAAAATARARVAHARAVASRPTADAKEWAWARFTGEVEVPNYELQASAGGMWRRGQEELTAPYVDRYFAELPGTAEKFSGWVLADVAQWYFPATSLDDRTLARAEELAARPDLDLSQRRRVADMVDQMSRRLAIRRKYGSAAS
ncbi:aminopeptidase N [Nocardioides speluncae]|uniref:aminopeptidase N n=1 Tax=Nocardioides speluncae TaxID=2670337 RepID=UPI000D68D35E|nr:aminopeptidase N [Nocardioides speluncae]